jgi:hypothetical protein
MGTEAWVGPEDGKDVDLDEELFDRQPRKALLVRHIERGKKSSPCWGTDNGDSPLADLPLRYGDRSRTRRRARWRDRGRTSRRKGEGRGRGE